MLIRKGIFAVSGEHRIQLSFNFKEFFNMVREGLSLQKPEKVFIEKSNEFALDLFILFAEVYDQIQEKTGSAFIKAVGTTPKAYLMRGNLLFGPLFNAMFNFFATQEGFDMLREMSAESEQVKKKLEEIILALWTKECSEGIERLEQFEVSATNDQLAEEIRQLYNNQEQLGVKFDGPESGYGKLLGRLDNDATLENVVFVFLDGAASRFAEKYSRTVIITDEELARLKALPDATKPEDFPDGVVLPHDTVVVPKMKSNKGDDTIYEYIQEPTRQPGFRPVAWLGADGRPEYSDDVDQETRNFMEQCAQIFSTVPKEQSTGNDSQGQ